MQLQAGRTVSVRIDMAQNFIRVFFNGQKVSGENYIYNNILYILYIHPKPLSAARALFWSLSATQCLLARARSGPNQGLR